MLNNVVLPDPFGPIRPVMLPRATSIEQSLSACTPPKALETPSVRSKAVMARSWRSADAPRGRPPLPAGPQGGQLLARRRQDPPRQQDDHHQEQRAKDALGHVRVGHLELGVAQVRLEQQR